MTANIKIEEGGGGGSSLNGLEFVTDTSATLLALLGGQKIEDDATVLAAGGVNSISILNGASATTMSATGLEAVAIGHDVTASGANSIAIGDAANASVADSICMGRDVTVVGTRGAISLGAQTAAGRECVTIGHKAESDLAEYAIAIGSTVDALGDGSISIGSFSDTNGAGAVAIGGDVTLGAQATAAGAIAIGGDDGTNAAASATTGARAVAVGSGAVASAADAWQFGIGTNSTADSLKISLSKIGFFDSTPVAKPTGVAVSAAGIHAALVTLNLITA